MNINKAGGADLSKVARGPMRLPHNKKQEPESISLYIRTCKKQLLQQSRILQIRTQ